MKSEYIAILIVSLITFGFLSVVTIYFMRKKEKSRVLQSINNLDIRRNSLSSTPVLVELNKIEDIAKSEQLEEKITEFKYRYEQIKTTRITKINDMIVDIDAVIEQKTFKQKEYYNKYADIEIELDETEYSIKQILNEIEEIASYEEKYRNIITKLKAKYRYLEKTFHDKESLFKDLDNVITMQFENIEKRFNDFEVVIDEKLYNEVLLVVRAIDTMIDHLDIVIRELPDILLLLNDLIPNRISDLKKEYDTLVSQEYPLGYLNFEETLESIEKKSSDILDRAKVLNIDDSLFELRTILEYLDNLFKDFDREKNAKSEFDENNVSLSERIKKNEKIIKSIYEQLDDIKSLYGLEEKDLEVIDKVNLKLSNLIKDYKALLREVKKCQISYMKINVQLYDLITRLINIEGEFDVAVKSLGSMYDDEQQAHEQTEEIKEVIKKCKQKVQRAHLPIVYDNYYVELNDVNEALDDVIKELNNKPIIIKSLNMRVETAKDLIFKLNETTNKMIEYANLTELLGMYTNRYRSDNDVDKGLSRVEMLYYAGEYQESYNLVLKILESKEPEISKRIKEYQVN